MRVCISCGRAFEPSSRHLRCPACRSRDLCVAAEGSRSSRQTCYSCRLHEKQFNGNWKGARTRHKAGYIMLHAPGHPRARTGSRYVFQHILVMEEMLGRHLLPDEMVTPPTTFRRLPERSWRWGESNPRPWATDQGFSGRSRRCDLASRLPSAEDLSASPGAMSGLSPQAEPMPSACSRRPSSGRRRSGGDGYLTVVRQRARSYRRLC